jgi:ATP/maltotriose-dependent transcriptional regulator MalT
LFADLLALELRRTAPQQLPGLHTTAAEWFGQNGHPIEAIHHAQAAENWSLAARLLADNWRAMRIDGRIATLRELLSRFPADTFAAGPELAVLAAADKRVAGSLREAERYLALAERLSPSAPEDRRGRFQVWLVLLRLALARARHDLDGVAEAAQRLLELADGAGAIEAGVGDESLRATALVELGAAEMWAGQLEAAERHLEQALEEARRIGWPMLELQALSHVAILGQHSFSGERRGARQGGDRAGAGARMGRDRALRRDRLHRGRQRGALARAAVGGGGVAGPRRVRPAALRRTDDGDDALCGTDGAGIRARPARGSDGRPPRC